MAVFHRRALPSQLPSQTDSGLEPDSWCKHLSTATIQHAGEQYGILCLPVQARRYHVLGLISHAAALIAIQSRQRDGRVCISPGVWAEVWLVDSPKSPEELRPPPRWSLAVPLPKGLKNFHLTPWQEVLKNASAATRIRWCIDVVEALIQLHKQPAPIVLQGLGIDSLYLNEATGRIQLWCVGAHKLQSASQGEADDTTNPDDKGAVCEWEMSTRPTAKRKEAPRMSTAAVLELDVEAAKVGNSLPPKAVSCPQLNSPAISSESFSSAQEHTFEHMVQQSADSESSEGKDSQVQSENLARNRVKFKDAVSEPLPKPLNLGDGYLEIDKARTVRRNKSLSGSQMPELLENQTLKPTKSTPTEGFRALAEKSVVKAESPRRHRPAPRSQSRLSLVSKPNPGAPADCSPPNSKMDDQPSSGSLSSTHQGTLTHRLSCRTDDSDQQRVDPCEVACTDDCEEAELPDMIMQATEFLLPHGNTAVATHPLTDVVDESKAMGEDKQAGSPPSTPSNTSSNPSNMPPGSGLRIVAQRSIDCLAKSQKSMKRTPAPKPPADTIHITDLPDTDTVTNTAPAVLPESPKEEFKAKSLSSNVIRNVPWLKLPTLSTQSGHNSMPSVFPKSSRAASAPEQPLSLIQGREEAAGASPTSAYNHLCMMLNGGQFNTLMKASGILLQAGPKLSQPSLAPEVFLKISEHDCTSDVFTFGVLMYQLLTGSTEVSQMPRQELAEKLSTGWRPPCLTDLHFGAWQLINRCWARYPKARPTLDEVLRCLKALHLSVSKCQKDQQKDAKALSKPSFKINNAFERKQSCCIM